MSPARPVFLREGRHRQENGSGEGGASSMTRDPMIPPSGSGFLVLAEINSLRVADDPTGAARTLPRMPPGTTVVRGWRYGRSHQ